MNYPNVTKFPLVPCKRQSPLERFECIRLYRMNFCLPINLNKTGGHNFGYQGNSHNSDLGKIHIDT